MKFVVLFEDNEDHADKRQQFMSDHLGFLEKHGTVIAAAGPLFDQGTGAGGLWVVDAADRNAVDGLIQTDPFWPTGLRQSVRVLEWKQVFADGKRLI